MRNRHGLLTFGLVALTTLTVSACEDEVTGIDDPLPEGQVSFDATDPANFTFISFADGGTVVDVADAQTSTEWVMAFRRFSVKLNGGVAGPGGVAGYNLENNATLDSAAVVNLTPADADVAWDAVTEAAISGATFTEDGLVEDDSGPWFRYDPIQMTLVANTGAAWKVQEADGEFSVFRVSDMAISGELLGSIQLEYRHQDAGADLGTAQTVDVAFPPGPPAPVFIDLATGTTVTPAGCNWDVSVAPYFVIDFNADCDGGTFPLDASEDFNGITDAGDAPEYGPFLSVISGAFPSTVEDAGGVFWYDLQSANRLWPTYNVFLVRVGTAIYKVQVLDYYNATGDSGFPTVRFEQLR